MHSFRYIANTHNIPIIPGSTKEKEIYKDMSAIDLVDRLLTKRCVSYYGRNENYLLHTGERGQGDFSTVGTDNETAPLLMENCLTRDEIKLTGFLLISSKVSRLVGEKTISVVAIGIPFPILNREGLFDWEDVMVTKKQNVTENRFISKSQQGFELNHEKILSYRLVEFLFY